MMSIVDGQRAMARMESLKQEIAYRQKQRRNWTIVALGVFSVLEITRLVMGDNFYLSENKTLAMMAFIWVVIILDKTFDQAMLIELRVAERSLESGETYFHALSGGQNLHRFIRQREDAELGNLLQECKRTTLASLLEGVEYTIDRETLLLTHVWS